MNSKSNPTLSAGPLKYSRIGFSSRTLAIVAYATDQRLRGVRQLLVPD